MNRLPRDVRHLPIGLTSICVLASRLKANRQELYRRGRQEIWLEPAESGRAANTGRHDVGRARRGSAGLFDRLSHSIENVSCGTGARLPRLRPARSVKWSRFV
jgi:hypothetical protein